MATRNHELLRLTIRATQLSVLPVPQAAQQPAPQVPMKKRSGAVVAPRSSGTFRSMPLPAYVRPSLPVAATGAEDDSDLEAAHERHPPRPPSAVGSLRNVPRSTWIAAAWIVAISLVVGVHLFAGSTPPNTTIGIAFVAASRVGTVVNMSYAFAPQAQTQTRYEACCRTRTLLVCGAAAIPCVLHTEQRVASCRIAADESLVGAACLLYLE